MRNSIVIFAFTALALHAAPVGRIHQSWVVGDGSLLVYAASDGAGGYENEGQSLHAYDPETGKDRLVMAEYFRVASVKPARTKAGATVLVVQLMDGMSDAPHAALVDPARGEVWRKPFAEVASLDGDALRVKLFREKDWDDHHDNPGHVVKATGEQTFSVSELARGAVITNEPRR